MNQAPQITESDISHIVTYLSLSPLKKMLVTGYALGINTLSDDELEGEAQPT